MSTPTEVEIQSLMDTAEREPWSFYEQLLDGRDGLWDEGAQAWLFSSYASCKQILRTDKRMFRHPARDASEDDDYRKLAGRAQPKFMPPEQHSKMHHWWMAQFHPNLVEELRRSLIRPLVSRNLERIAARGHAELAGEFVERVPVRVIAGVMGLPYEDDALIDHFKTPTRGQDAVLQPGARHARRAGSGQRGGAGGDHFPDVRGSGRAP